MVIVHDVSSAFLVIIRTSTSKIHRQICYACIDVIIAKKLRFYECNDIPLTWAYGIGGLCLGDTV